jgi:hypothetical protein
MRLNGERMATPGTLLTVAALTIVLPCALPRSASATGTIVGASQAVCTPSPCRPSDGPVSFELTGVENGDGTSSTRAYGVYRPQGLTASATNRAPAVLVFYQAGNCGLRPSGRFSSLAPERGFVVVYMEVPCERDDNWDKRNADPATGTTVNDEPYVTAVVEAIRQCPESEAAINQCVDPQRIYAAGASSGGNMVADVMCDVHNSPLFRGYLIDSSSLELFNGAPNCPSDNRSYFVMSVLSNYSIDGGLYYDEAANPHLDTLTFADWAAARLGCTSRRIDDAIGYPVASTLRYSYSAPCAYATDGSRAAVALGVQNGGHTWVCQDSDLQAQPEECTNMPVPPGLTADGLPDTNGLFIEQEFWDFVAEGVSSEADAAPLADTSAPLVSIASPAEGSTISGTISVDVQATDDISLASVRLELDGRELGTSTSTGEGEYSFAWDTSADANEGHRLRVLATDQAGNLATVETRVTVSNVMTVDGGPSSGGQVALLTGDVGSSFTSTSPQVGGRSNGQAFVALGDGYASGDGNAHYLAGTDTARDRCHRSTASYPYIASALLSAGPLGLAFHACSGAKILDLYRRNRRDSESAQLSAMGDATRLVTVSVGQVEALLPSLLSDCTSNPTGCGARWRGRSRRALVATGPRLYRLYRAVAERAPRARVLVVGYAQPFPASRRARCQAAGRESRLTRSRTQWLNSYVRRLDNVIRRAADRAHVTFLDGSYDAFAGHEVCTRQSAFNARLAPDARGQALLARLVENAALAQTPPTSAAGLRVSRRPM